MKPTCASPLLAILLGFCAVSALCQQAPKNTIPASKPTVSSQVRLRACSQCIRANEEFLASDAMQGRGSGTHDELLAATYIGSELRQYGVEPAGDDGGYIQRAPTVHLRLTSPPQIKITPPGNAAPATEWTYGKEFVVVYLTQVNFSGPLQKLNADDSSNKEISKIEPGAVVLVTGMDRGKIRRAAFAAAGAGAAAELLPSDKNKGKQFEEAGKELPKLPAHLKGETSSESNFNVLDLSPDAVQLLETMAAGTWLHFEAPAAEDAGATWNAVGILRGSDPALHHAVLLSAHLDHLGIGKPVNGDNIYNGADDDASGTTAVLELARVMGRGKRPRRTVIFAWFGSEEAGGLGSTYFRDHPALPLAEIAANLEFEMIGRPDPALKADTVWLSGWERSNLGPTLAAHGARLVGDPHPNENFFARSDNYVLAKKGVVAQTISSYGLHKDYHQPSDDVVHLDFKHLDAAIGSLLGPIEWLVNSDFKPKWNKGGQP